MHKRAEVGSCVSGSGLQSLIFCCIFSGVGDIKMANDYKRLKLVLPTLGKDGGYVIKAPGPRILGRSRAKVPEILWSSSLSVDLISARGLVCPTLYDLNLYISSLKSLLSLTSHRLTRLPQQRTLPQWWRSPRRVSQNFTFLPAPNIKYR